MAASKTALLILRSELWGRSRLVAATEIKPAIYIFPLEWLVTGRLRGAQMLDPSSTLSNVEGASFVGLVGPRALGSPLYSYVLVYVLGWLTLSIPVLVRLRLGNSKKLSLDNAKSLVSEIVSLSSMHPDVIAGVQKRVSRARSLVDITRAVEWARE
ncbi:hypothetical protein [Methylocystis heyeri]|uniref:Uncharacterized protein n=1 Tax=Methylocystis heyeri TaxID=391905 RepID=A0A6B8KMW0_9HYPH|nr:hypothetical protein [Methylocystis heyeri]QGM48323.1 hypothetical protein H2LOC_021255 [Methylocystis heyeri]